MGIFKGKDKKGDEPKSTDEIIDEKNLEEKEAEVERGGAEHRTQPSEGKKGESIENITNEMPPNTEKVDLLKDAEDGKDTKRKPTTTITKKEEIPKKENTESEAAKTTREGKEKVRKARNPKSHAFKDDGTCVRCGAGNKVGSTTTDCFGRPLPTVTAEKVKEGIVDYVGGAWIKIEPCEEEAKAEHLEDIDEDEEDSK